MKKILYLLLLAMPFAANAQDLEHPAKKNGFEIGLNTGLAFNSKGIYDDLYFGGRNVLSFYKNFKLSQIGTSVEFGVTGTGGGSFFSINAIANRTFHFEKMYLYGGGLIGYKNIQPEYTVTSHTQTGYQVGLQAGIVRHLGRHFSFNAELAARGEQIWYTRDEDIQPFAPRDVYTIAVRGSYFELYYPVTIGIRYRF